MTVGLLIGAALVVAALVTGAVLAAGARIDRRERQDE